MALLRRLRDLLRDDEEVEAHELRERSTSSGGKAVADAHDREVITAIGTITSVTLRPRDSVPALVADLYDGSQQISLTWLGRRQIRGINPGVTLRATGRVCHPKGVATIFNPAYEIVPSREHRPT
ncbi:OB-fold nucleic acid binding domain-containing protein [Janibacter sp. GXQ6167]|uniref:OB-fold nucleic acid binding domain-containing protein n=1 Tax=Janibacter sp. GXQ6167 TaxID=3240791 RepID=UPI0035259D01